MDRVLLLGEPGAHERLVDVLRSGGLAIMPCDTIYGIVGRVPETEARMRALKGRSETKPFIQLIGNTTWLDRMTDTQPDPAILGLWPGALTLVVRARGRVGGTVAVRFPSDDLLIAVLRALDCPLYSTSVNRAGETPLTSVAEMTRILGPSVDLVVDAGDRAPAPPSTIVDVTARPYRVLRQGVVRVPAELLQPER